MNKDDEEFDVEDLKQNRICCDCVGDEFLRDEIERVGTNEECSYCDVDAKTISLEDFADYVDTAFDQHYHQTSTEPEGLDYLLAKEGRWERDGEYAADAIADSARIDNDPADHVRQILNERHYDLEDAKMGEEGEFAKEAQYKEGPVDDYELREKWRRFQKSLQTESRLFNREAEGILESLFEGLEDHKTHEGRSAIFDAGPGKEINALFRARVFQSEEKLEEALERPDLELGPPPAKHAIAGRMNARGIAVFYGSTDPDVALAETRPPVGSKVAVARFEITRPLRLLDIEVLGSLFVDGSVFDSTWLDRLKKAKFLQTVSHRITEPVMPDDEPFDYLVTQAIADYLAGRSEPAIDGIIYPSVQDGGNMKNVALFHKAARVETLDIPDGTQINSYLVQYDESFPDYSVHEVVPPTKDDAKKPVEVDDFLSSLLRHPPMPREESHDMRTKTLRIDIDSVEVNHIQSVAYGKQKFGVRRHRSEKRGPVFRTTED